MFFADGEDIESPEEGTTEDASGGSIEENSNIFTDDFLVETKLCLLKRKMLALQLDLVDLQRRNLQQEVTLLAERARNRKLAIALADVTGRLNICDRAKLSLDADCRNLATIIEKLRSNWPKAEEAKDWAQQFEGTLLSDIVLSEEELLDMMYHISKSGFAEAAAAKSEFLVLEGQAKVLVDELELWLERDRRNRKNIHKMIDMLTQWAETQQMMAILNNVQRDLRVRDSHALVQEPTKMEYMPPAKQKYPKDRKQSEEEALSQAIVESSSTLR